MNQNILNNRTTQIKTKLTGRHYYDYMLFGGTKTVKINDLDSIKIADFSCPFLIEDNCRLYSSVIWDDAVNNGILLENIGMTGVDNGFVRFDKRTITNEEFLKLYFDTEFEIAENEKRLFMTPVVGNTQRFSFPLFISDKEDDCYLIFKGGFFQGFYKIFGKDYQVLPNRPNSDWILHFDIRPRNDYEIPKNTVNSLHPENKGIFFHMGLRGENKFWEYYKTDKEKTDDFIINPNHKDENNPKGTDYVVNDPDYTEEGYFYENPDDKCDYYGYYGDDYFKDNCGESGLPIDPPYIKNDIPLDENEIIDEKTDSEGHYLDKRGYYKIKTDNKFIFFNRTPTGYTTENYIEGMEVVLEGRDNSSLPNLFTLMNRTPTGYTVNDIDKLEEKYEKTYNVNDGFGNNGFALQITDDGAIGYKYAVLDCEKEGPERYTFVSEFSKKGIVKFNEWNSVNVRIVNITQDDMPDKCENNKPYKIKILIYVNGFLKLVSQELDGFLFRPLDDIPEKQEGVPYNISLGGGTLGLLETISLDYYKVSNHLFPVEKTFCGTFIGDMKSFRFYNGFADYSAIKDYLS